MKLNECNFCPLSAKEGSLFCKLDSTPSYVIHCLENQENKCFIKTGEVVCPTIFADNKLGTAFEMFFKSKKDEYHKAKIGFVKEIGCLKTALEFFGRVKSCGFILNPY